MPIYIKAFKPVRRAGVAHPKGTKEYSDDAFTPEQLKKIKKDPRLSVVITDATEDDDQTNQIPPSPQGALVGEDRILELVALIEALDTENPELWTQNGNPKASALPSTTAEERDAAWKAFQGLQADKAAANNSAGEE